MARTTDQRKAQLQREIQATHEKMAELRRGIQQAERALKDIDDRERGLVEARIGAEADAAGLHVLDDPVRQAAFTMLARLYGDPEVWEAFLGGVLLGQDLAEALCHEVTPQEESRHGR